MLIAIVNKPFGEKKEIDILRKSLLGEMRFKLAIELASYLPVKNEVQEDDDYIAQVQVKTNEYLSLKNHAILNYFNSEKIYKKYVFLYKIFKNAIIGLPIVVILCSLVLFTFYSEKITIEHCVVSTVILIALLLLLWFLKERMKDKYTDLCDEYEVAE